MSKLHLIIIVPDSFEKTMGFLATYKESTGIETEVITLSSIYRQTEGRDEAERVKRYLWGLYKDRSLQYAMLVGDSEVFPVRYTKMEHTWDDEPGNSHWTAFYPTDFYYSCLINAAGDFDSWDNNNNGYFGEIKGTRAAGILNADGVSLRPNIAVGRVPASTPQEALDYATKVIRYEFNTGRATWNRDIILSAWDWPDKQKSCGIAKKMETLFRQNGYNVERFCHPDSDASDTPSLTSRSLKNRISQGVLMFCYIGHGSCMELQRPGADTITFDDIAAINNSGRFPIFVTAACSLGTFGTEPAFHRYVDIDGVTHIGSAEGEIFPSLPPQPACLQKVNNRDCFAERGLVLADRGLIGFFGVSTGAQSGAADLVQYAAEAIDAGHTSLGSVWNFAVSRYYQEHVPTELVDPPDWRVTAEFHQPWKWVLFGDPSLRIGGVVGN